MAIGKTCFAVQSGIKIQNSIRTKIDAVLSAFPGCDFVNPKMPEGYKYWITIPNLGEPFESNLQRRIETALRSANVFLPTK